MNKQAWMKKLISVLLSLVIYTLFYTWLLFKDTELMYISFIDLFSSNLTHYITPFLFIGLLSSWIDDVMSIKKGKLNVHWTFKFLFYLGIGIFVGVVLAFVQHQIEFVTYFIQQSIIAVILLFIIQWIIDWFLRNK